MEHASSQNPPVRAKAVLVDPQTLTVAWTNESAAGAGEAGAVEGASLAAVVPLAESMGVTEAVREVAETGVPRHLKADVVSTSRGGVALVTSVYRIPNGFVLILTENAWQVAREGDGSSHGAKGGRSGRRRS